MTKWSTSNVVTLGQIVNQWRRLGNKTAVIQDGSNFGKDEISYANLASRVVDVADALFEQHHVRLGTRVAFSPSNTISALITFFAIVSLGAICVMVPASEPPERRLAKVRRTRSVIWLHEMDKPSAGRTPVEKISDLVSNAPYSNGQVDRINREVPQPDDPAVVFFTTGSTATAKAVVQSHRNVVVNCAALAEHHRLSSVDRLIGVLPMHYANGLELSLVTPLLAGSTAVLLYEFNPISYLETCARYRATIASVVPALLDAILTTRGSPDLQSLRYFVSAAAPLTSLTARSIWNRFGKQVIQGYGLSETTNFSTSLPIDLTEDEYRACVLDAPIPMVGGAVNGCEVGIFALDGTPVAIGESGEVCIRGDSVMLGYDQAPEENDVAFRDEWFRSGDEGFMSYIPSRPDPMLTLTGRFKNIIKVGGVGVSLDEVDRCAQGVDGVRDAVSLRSSHPILGEAVFLLISARSNVADSSSLRTAVLKALELNVGLTVAAVTVEVRSELPRTPNGKVIRWQV